MAELNEKKAVETVSKPQKTVAKQSETVSKPQNTVSEPTYTVEEFVAAPSTLGVESTDLIRAAFRNAGKEEATVSEAKNLVNDFRKKEVK